MTERLPSQLDQLANQYLREFADLDPVSASALGLTGYDTQLTDYSPDGAAAREANRVKWLAAFRAAPISDATDEVTMAALEYQLGLERELYAAGEHTAELNNIACPLQYCRDAFDLMPTATEDDWANIAARMTKIPGAMEGYIATLREGIRRGLTPAALQVDEGIKQAGEIADPKESFFVKLAAGAIGDAAPPENLRADLARAAQAAAAAYGKLEQFFSDELAAHARPRDGVGRERYERFSRLFVGTKVDLDETYEWGIDELNRMADEQASIARIIAGPGASVEEAIEVLDTDPARKLRGVDALHDWMQTTADEAVAALNGKYFDIPEPMLRIEAMIAPTQSGGIYYSSPSDDFSRPGRMWWSVPPGVTEFNTWREKTTVYHEGVPGHHLQIGMSTYCKAELNDWRRMGAFYSGHGEGWALYAERLMEEFGFLEDPGDRLGMVDGQRMRATRVVLDIGVHLGKPAPASYGGGIWDVGKAWQLMEENVHSAPEFNRFELTRYLGWPGQAPSYKLGQRLWEQLRSQTAAQQGLAFDLKEFHNRALRLGSVPLAVLPKALGLAG
ncbi:MAG: DUF885 domain-containing protein [Propionibacteriaceae bacterium]|nr:DUF885 domain-containing protein [Propionibacteriaceae bacterium]